MVRFGFGWSLAIPKITRKTDKGIPRYRDEEESDVFILSQAEDLVPALRANGEKEILERSRAGRSYVVQRYRPRIEGLFARIERWRDRKTDEVHWRVTTKDNITSIYGDSHNSQVADPEKKQHIFSWLLSRTYDDKGNLVVYEYKAEDSDNVVNELHEQNRLISANRYIKRISYSYQTPYFPADNSDLPNDWHVQVVFDYGEHDLTIPRVEEGAKWGIRPDSFSTYRSGFEIRTHRRCRRVLMFHDFAELGNTPCLVRSTDLTFLEDDDTTLSQSLIASFLVSIAHSGYVRKDGGYLKSSFPPIEFGYTKAQIDQTLHKASSSILENLPEGIDGSRYQWVDIDGEGTSGVLTQLSGAWYYKRNLTPLSTAENPKPRFGSTEVLKLQPTYSGKGSTAQQLLDLAGDGRLDVVHFEGATAGFFERTENGGWDSFTAFVSSPNIPWGDTNLKFIDLTGDGHADILISEAEVFTWYPSLGEEGFGPAETVRKAAQEEDGPRIVFADGTQSVYLADMSGDGLNDLVRIRNAEVCYWPNLGYGRFGSKVSMSAAPLLDHPDLFDQKRVRLADIDGSGVTDLIYLGQDVSRVYFNRSGNSWSPGVALDQMPSVDNLGSITAMDLFGNGTACLVWSHPGPAQANEAMRYVDLMGGTKPHLLTTIKNNLGAETRMKYVPSTRFYLQDLYDGKPWKTKLSFPVHVLEQVEVLDWVSKTKLVTRYKYHHGYFDGPEREFRGFGMVEQWDTEEFVVLSKSDTLQAPTNVDAASHIPPVCTRTWFHTGACLGENRISRHFEDEYYHEGDQSGELSGLTTEQLEAMLLPDTELPTTLRTEDDSSVSWALTAEEVREACRALKGSILRQELYALDGSDKEDRPYSASERSYTIELLQPRSENKHAVFFTHARETIDFHYERRLFDVLGKKLADPRVTHSLTLAVDKFGNVLTSADIGYGRRHVSPDPLLTATDRAKQKQTLITYTENAYTNSVEEADAYRAPLLSDVRMYELIELPSLIPAAHEPQITNLFRFAELEAKIQAAGDGDHDIPYENFTATGIQAGHPYRRLIKRVSTKYRRDDLTTLLPLGELQTLALAAETYKLAFTAGLLSGVYQRQQANQSIENLLPNSVAVLAGNESDQGGFVDLDDDGNWWVPSGQVFYHPANATPPDELAEAREHFFLPRQYRDPFDQSSVVTFDTYNLLMIETTDALNNQVTAINDYRVLQPRRITDPNGNHTEVAFDALGLVAATALMDKETEGFGDLLDASFEADLTQAELDAFMSQPREASSSSDESIATEIVHSLLGRATTRIVYDLNRFMTAGEPCFASTIARETHVSDLQPGEQPKIQIGFSYSDGFGREVQKKIQAEPGPVVVGGPFINPRWVGSGWITYNNKGKPVRQYEPFFAATHEFEFAKQAGVGPILFYDPVERVVATLYPNHTWEKVNFDPWQQTTYDTNDTVLNADGLSDPKLDEDVKGFFSRLSEAEYLPTWYEQRIELTAGDPERIAAEKAVLHKQTPTVSYVDALGRVFFVNTHNRFVRNSSEIEEKYCSRIELDIEGNQRAVRDAVVQNGDALGRIIMACDYDMVGNCIHQTSMEAGERWILNDVTGKPIRNWDSRGFTRRTTYDELRRPTGLFVSTAVGERLAERTVYGEIQGTLSNHRSRVFQVFDDAGIATSEAYDFKGNLRRSKRALLPDYKGNVDWQQNSMPSDEAFTTTTTYDALNRVVAVTTPDNSIFRPTYNEANLLNRVEVNLRGTSTATPFINNIDYNPKGQRVAVNYANGAQTTYEYDDLTFRLVHLSTTRNSDQNGLASQIFNDPGIVQDLHYTYDAEGNITRIADDALATVVHGNEEVATVFDYTYDAIYRLIEAAGREHIGQTALASIPSSANLRDYPFAGSNANSNDLQALRNYIERYEWDAAGNFDRVIHQAANGNWTRAYSYNEASLMEPTKRSNRLSNTTVGQSPENYVYDAHGNMTTMPQLTVMQWNFKDRLQATARQAINNGTPETTFYLCDAVGQRMRKVTQRQNGTRTSERIYLGGLEIYREYDGNGAAVVLERQTLHVLDDKKLIALVESRTIVNGNEADEPTMVQRYQLPNHLESACLELDAHGGLISYEEYHPYGTSAYQAMNTAAEVSLKRYRYTSKERDEETGLYYHGARYYASWLGTSDSAGSSRFSRGAELLRLLHE